MTRSALVLKGLCATGRRGRWLAAATTSLPESIGGVRNWDYRYCWPRDAAMSGTALVTLGSTEEALRLLDWLLGVVDRVADARSG
jgi:trehalose 6-phosphate phosphatase